jgi:hypothetical protein
VNKNIMEGKKETKRSRKYCGNWNQNRKISVEEGYFLNRKT